VDPQIAEQPCGALVASAAVEDTARPHRLLAERDVLGHGHVRDERQLLKDRADAKTQRVVRRAQLRLATPELD
jgi:hypothetical protein